MAEYKPLFAAASLPDGTMRRVIIDDEALVIVHQGDEWFAMVDCCSHENYALSDGYLAPGKIFCAMHGAAFALSSGEALNLPAYENVATRPVRIKDGLVEVELED